MSSIFLVFLLSLFHTLSTSIVLCCFKVNVLRTLIGESFSSSVISRVPSFEHRLAFFLVRIVVCLENRPKGGIGVETCLVGGVSIRTLLDFREIGVSICSGYSTSSSSSTIESESFGEGDVFLANPYSRYLSASKVLLGVALDEH